ncbi:bestrophin family ion channel [Kiloniella laminariae]|uniref:Bestrophin family ion channel n=1 Tax=Kiloniella laminariae TaxID=454162 RepID=A0ABT4LFN1_9PROT|nr:bestrophin family ion channel [Kiloniella laminariae]MCZ4279903.1 bestrophin family ion channel [Kiloniella laminariae]
MIAVNLAASISGVKVPAKMIVREKPNAFKLFFLLRGSVVPSIAPQIIFAGLMGFLVYLADEYFPDQVPNLTATPFVLLGVTLSIFLGFRNSASYERWWEARKLWGQLIIDTRSIARQAQTYIWDQGGDVMSVDEKYSREQEIKTHQRKITLLCTGFSHALRHQLRGTDCRDDVASFLSEYERERLGAVRHIPNFFLNLLGGEISQILQKQFIGEVSARNLEERITSLSSVLAACERIHNTPLPFAYNLLLNRTAYIYCFTLPLGLFTSLGAMTPLITALIAYTFFGLEALGEELEDPFGTSAHDLALSTMSRTIEINLLETLNEAELPEPIQADRYYFP